MAIELAWKNDPQAFDALVRMLKDAPDASRQRQTVNALVELGDKRTPAVLLDRIENDPAKTALVDELLSAATSFRQPDTADRMLALGDKGVSWDPIYTAARRQRVRPAGPRLRGPEPGQEVGARSAPAARRRARQADGAGPAEQARSQARGPDRRRSVGPVERGGRGTRPAHEPERRRRARWGRDRDRLAGAQAERQPRSPAQGPAAQGLGTLSGPRRASPAKRAEGINVLLAAVDYVEDVSLREEAVQALGAGRQAGGGPAHAPGERARPRPPGRGGRGPRAWARRRIRARCSSSPGTREDGLPGQGRYPRAALATNAREGWDVIRQRALDPTYWDREVAVEALGHNDTPETRETLAKVLAQAAEDASWVFSAAVTALRKLFGEASLEPDYLVLRSGASANDASEVEEAANRVCKSGSAARMLEILPACHPDVQDELAVALQARTDVPADQLVGAGGRRPRSAIRPPTRPAVARAERPRHRPAGGGCEVVGRLGPAPGPRWCARPDRG